MKKICRNCYYENPDSATYCCSCGIRLDSPPPKKKKKEIKVYVDALKSKTIRESYHEIESKVRSIIVDKLSVDESEVKDNANFEYDLGADSLDAVELVMEFEKEFEISIPDNQAEHISTVRDAISCIINNMNR